MTLDESTKAGAPTTDHAQTTELAGPEPLLSVEQAAKYVGCSLDYIYKRSAAGKLAHYKLAGRLKFKRADLDAFIESHRQGGER